MASPNGAGTYDPASAGPPPAATSRTGFTETLGSSGTNIYAGLIQKDYLPALNGQAAYTIFDQMRRSESTCAATLAVWELPLRACAWSVEPADADDDLSIEQADFASYNLFEYGRQSFDSLLYEICTMFAFGFSVFEKNYAYMGDDYAGRLGLKRLAYRDQKSIYRWYVQDGDLLGIDQLGPPKWKPTPIPADKLAVFTHRKEGDNWEGISLLRPAYKNWLIKDSLYRLQAVALERGGMGIPMAQWDDTLSASQISDIKRIVEEIRVNESVGVTIPTKSVVLSILEPKGLGQGIQAFQTAIDHHDLKIAASCLAGFLNLVGGQTGSYALSADHSELLMYALAAAADYIADVFNQQIIPQLTSLNFGEQKAYSKLRHSRIGGAHLADLGTTMRGLADAGLLTPDLPTENALRDELGLPERTEEQVAAEQAAALQQAVQMQAVMSAQAEPDATDNGGDQPAGAGSGDGQSANQPATQGKLRALSEQMQRTLPEATARLTNATRRLALSERSQQYGERPSHYRERSRRRVWAVS